MSHSDELLISSMDRCMMDGGFFDTFYHILFEKSPRAESAFQEVDMESQKEKLKSALPRFLGLKDKIDTKEASAQHARHHSHLQTTDYGLWIDVLCRTFELHDPYFNKSLETEIRQRAKSSVEVLRGRPEG